MKECLWERYDQELFIIISHLSISQQYVTTILNDIIKRNQTENGWMYSPIKNY